ncbi:hypothetical protein QVG61_05910 [Thiohalobacter sp. IOR34]|uniref:hypothetical protein n=1 Tax=Thiohalobacter sp. IOR34 TaxID=3057176 RepID=UPI0025B04CB0|nr:hypothetical protein [Thiohalobacter sp. IOR34]WJW76624.1 hypothetical protein QVG61_05910 [Thiohalobacter sp. IOR34]
MVPLSAGPAATPNVIARALAIDTDALLADLVLQVIFFISISSELRVFDAEESGSTAYYAWVVYIDISLSPLLVDVISLSGLEEAVAIRFPMDVFTAPCVRVRHISVLEGNDTDQQLTCCDIWVHAPGY